MPASPYFFYRPIVASDRRWVALDWQCATPAQDDGAELVRRYAQSDATSLAKTLPLLVPITPQALDSREFVDRFAAADAVFVLPESTLDDAPTLARCAELRRRGRRLALHVERGLSLHAVPDDSFDALWIDASLARQELSTSDLAQAGERGLRLIASKVDSHEMFGWVTDKGFDWSDSHFLTAQNPLNNREPDLARLKLLKLLNLVKEDGDTRVIEEVFREEAKLSYNLLKLVNSVALNVGIRISNFAQAITILGRRQLQRWLQMLVYADHLADDNTPNPLMQLAALRARQMELLSMALTPQPEIARLSDNAFMVGLFSLLEVLINLPTKEILKELPVPEATVDALLNRSRGGVLGQMLSALVAGEAGDFASAETTLRALGIDCATHANAQIAALHWAANIGIGQD